MVFAANFYGIVRQAIVGIDPVRAFKKNKNKIISHGNSDNRGKEVYEEQI